MTAQPLPVGTRVYHARQEWARRENLATGTVREIKGPYHDGTYEYVVTTGEDISRRLGPDNPETRTTQWSSWLTAPVGESL